MENEGSMNVYRYLSIKEMYAAHTKILVNYQMPGVSSDISRFFIKGTITYLVKTYSLTIKSNSVIQETKNALNLPYSIGYLKSRIYVTVEEGTNLITISATLPDKDRIAAFLNTLIDKYIELQTGFMNEDAVKAGMYVHDQLNMVGKDLKSIQNEIKIFKEKNGIVDMNTEMNSLVSTYSHIKLEKLNSEMEKNSINKSIKKINQQLNNLKNSKDTRVIKDIENSPEFATYLKLQEEYEQASVYYKKNSAYLKGIEARLIEMKAKLLNKISAMGDSVSIFTLYSQKTTLEKRLIELNYQIMKSDFLLKNLDRKFKAIPETEMEYLTLARKLSINEKLYSVLLEQEKQLELQNITQGSTIRIVDRAITPSRAVTTSKTQYFLFMFMISLIVSLGFAFLIEYLDTTVKPSDNIEKMFDVNLIGKIPEIYQNEDKLSKWAIITGKRAKYITRTFKENLITNISQKSTVHESYKELRTLLSYSKGLKDKKGVKSLIITSSETKEGKSITVANLSIILSLNKKKTIVVDADMRKPALHRIFNVSNNLGVTNYFEGTVKNVKEIISPGVNPYHSILSCGPHTRSSSEFLDSPKVFKLIKELSDIGYEYILFDTPPVNALTDAVVLSNKVDGVLFVIRSNQIGRHRVTLAIDSLKKSGGKLIGVVLNGIPLRGGYGYYYYYYGQTYYYNYDDVDK
jgi:capsular exopolysaccharide synthesis family protein